MSSSPSALRLQALSLYRKLLREAHQMPTGNQKSWLVGKIRNEFRKNKDERDPDKISFLLKYAEVSLDNVIVQRAHLSNFLSAATPTPQPPSQKKLEDSLFD